MEPSTRKRKSTDRDSDGGSSDDEQEIEEEQKYLQLSTSQVKVCTMVYLSHIHLVYPPMLPELTIEGKT